MNKMRVTSNYAHYRLLGYAATLLIQGGNSIAMYLMLQGDIMKDQELQRFYSLQWIYITIWNVMNIVFLLISFPIPSHGKNKNSLTIILWLTLNLFIKLIQLIYASLGILCDLPTLLEIKEHKLLKYLKSYRDILCVSLIVPTGLMIFSIFWPVYIYDREMIFPTFIDKVLSQISNHVMHTAILPMVLWEFTFLPKTEPKSHKLNLLHTYGLFVCYLYVLFSTFAVRGIWPYPVLKHIYGTIYFPLVFIFISVSAYITYYAQWPVNALLWGSSTKISKKEN